MTKKNLKPQQAAPVQREINTTSSTSSVDGTGLTPHITGEELHWGMGMAVHPFAGDDAE
ncbi:anacyclamide/piricyclamide family prenylated cyclic peptide [Planktothrix agardhii 1033]|nr:anacyclamide/piricyclamide family prenylated cyclic peptide [Planktothrix agardhii 1033]